MVNGSPLALWESARFVDPKHTKDFSRSGGFKGTATNATYLIRRATEVFGPAGIGWGWDIIDERYTPGAPILTSDGVQLAVEVIHSVRVKLWFMHKEQRGEITHFGQTIFVGRNKNGLFSDDEAPKKSLTDAITKALSCLGFAADIHMGLWDDSKYVTDDKNSSNNSCGSMMPANEMDNFMLAISNAKTKEALRACLQNAMMSARKYGDAYAHDRLKNVALDKVKTL